MKKLTTLSFLNLKIDKKEKKQKQKWIIPKKWITPKLCSVGDEKVKFRINEKFYNKLNKAEQSELTHRLYEFLHYPFNNQFSDEPNELVDFRIYVDPQQELKLFMCTEGQGKKELDEYTKNLPYKNDFTTEQAILRYISYRLLDCVRVWMEVNSSTGLPYLSEYKIIRE